MPPQRMALIGSKGMLAQAVRESCTSFYRILPYDLPEFDLTDRELVLQVLGSARPDIIVNCAAYTNVDQCESEPVLAHKVNGDGPGFLAEAAKIVGAVLIHFSTDYVFDGTQTTPYREADAPRPKSEYGRSKLRGEMAIANSGLEEYYILRTSWLYGPGGKNFVETIVRLAGEREELRVVADQFGGPTFTRDLAEALHQLIDNRANYGIYHFSNGGECSWYDFAAEIVAQAHKQDLNLSLLRLLPIRTEEYPLPAPRPAYSVFCTKKYVNATSAAVPVWQDALGRYFAERKKVV
ncbi:dTDP-4-dehydrorhamnose reductase [Trichloromonas sp.]|uniref:dTDP-4-dehydrorhamnose reductase n=1 Tax=Trichloromonas sp. TaxID=3069249 RepID=UPI003D816A5A